MLKSNMLFLPVLLLWASQTGAQETVSVAVEDKDYFPYYYWSDDGLEEPCGDITTAVFAAMGYVVVFESAPWTRAIRMVEEGTIDAALCATETVERNAFARFPDEPLLSYDVTLFVQADSPLQFSSLGGLFGLSFGVVAGYSFGGDDDMLEAGGMIRQETSSRESLVQVLLAGRVDAILDSRLPIMADAERLGAEGELRALRPSLSETPAYLMFSDKDGAEDLVHAFSEELISFKKTLAYREIADRYGLGE